MILTLTKFKCWDDLTLTFIPNSVILLKAPSGGGKTTICKAIEWVLYGKAKKVGPHHTPNAKTKVSLTINDILIVRTKNPNHLSLTIDNINYTNESAQTKINNTFGEYDVWLSTSYIAQKSYHHFLLSSNSDKMSMLNKLSFPDNNPSLFINKINEKLEDYKQQLIISEKTLINNNYVLLTDKEEKEYELVKLKEEDQLLLNLKKDYDIKSALKEEKLNMLKKINYNNININYSVEELYRIKEKIKEKGNCNNSINKSDKVYTLDDLQYVTDIEKQYKKNDEILKRLNLPHCELAIHIYIHHYNQIINDQPYLHKKQQLLSLPNINFDDKLLDQLIKEKENIEQSLKSKECPHCHKLIIYQNDQFIKFDSEKCTDGKQKLKLIDTQLNTLYKDKQTYDKVKIEKDRLELELSKLHLPHTSQLLSPKEQEVIRQNLSTLNIIKIVQPLPYTSEEAKQYLTFINYHNIIKNIPIDFIDSTEKDIDNLINILNNNSKYKVIEEEINSIVVGDDVTDKLDNVQTKIKLITKLLDEHPLAVKYNEDKKNIDTLVKKIDKLNELKLIAVDLECKILEDTVNTLNCNIITTCQHLFSNDIRMNLELFKNDKQRINFDIRYKGGKYTSILDLSGGEGNLISLAFTIAFSKMTSSPIVMFDELFGSLDNILKTAIISLLKQHLHCTILLIEHELETPVDQIIDFDNL